MGEDNDPDNPPIDPVDAAAWMWRRFFVYILDPNHTGPITAIATVALVVTTITYTIYSGRQWRATKEAADAAKSAADTAAAELRPWMEIDGISFTQPLTIGRNGELRTVVQIAARNVGKTPAQSVDPEFKFDGSFFDFEKMCAPQTHSTGSPIPAFGDIVFPDRATPEMGYGVGGNAFPIRGQALTYLLPMNLVACVRYKSSVSQEWYSTGVVYSLIIRNPEGLNVVGIKFDSRTGASTMFPPPAVLTPLSNANLGTDTAKIPQDWIKGFPSSMENEVK